MPTDHLAGMMERRLAAILAADVVGYSRLMSEDEIGTLDALRCHRSELLDPKLAEWRGRIVKLMGDGALVEFASAIDAVNCAIEIQQGMALRNEGIANGRRIQFRIGINLGDVIIDGEDIYGEGVNLAARLEEIAEPGGICISGPAFQLVDGKIDRDFIDAGELALKNLARPVRVHRWPANGNGSVEEMPTGTSVALADRSGIAVLPFTNMSDDPEQRYFADGITEDIITGLASWHWFPVISRHSTFNYRERGKSTAEVARELGARYIVEGSVRRAGQRARVSAQLIDAHSDHQIWSERYDVQIADIFDVQDHITDEIATSLVPELSHAERRRARRKHSADLGVWDMIWRAQSYVFDFDEAQNRMAIELLKAALASDPDSAHAWSMLALARYKEAILGFNDDRHGSLGEAGIAANTAVKLDGRDWLAHAVCGICHVWTERDFEPALEHERIAVQLNPSSSWARAFLSCVLEFGGSPKEAIDELHTALRLDPRSPLATFFMSDLAICYFLLRDYEQATHVARKALELNPANVRARQRLVATLAESDRVEEARAEFQKLVRRQPDFSPGYVRETYPFRSDQDAERFIAALRRAGLGM